MDLTKEAYQALEDIVGPEFITQDPAIRDTYNQVWGNKLVFDTKFSNRPAAVVLPGNTKEVQAVVRACNRYKISFKPFSSGFEIMSTALVTENAITLDLKRMDKIVEIDTKNMHAVVEPYVSVFRLQLELAKHRLFLGPISAGPEAGVIASSCCHFGTGNTQVFTGGLGRNVLGCEWVLPTGEILRMGSAEASNGWFSADGPGFGLRGILRGHSGANGGHGVITKVSHKLYHWYGPPEWELVGSPPGMKQLEKVMDGFKFFILTFPDADTMYDAIREIGQAGIAYSLMQYLEGIKSEGNDEFFATIQEMLASAPPDAPDFGATSLTVVIGGNSRGELEFREKCLLKICENLGGAPIPQLNDPSFLAWRFGLIMWGFNCVKECFRPCSEFFITPCTDGTEDFIKIQRKAAVEAIMPHVLEGELMFMPSPPGFHLPHENYSVGSHIENITPYDPYDDESLEGMRSLIAETFDPNGKFRSFGVPVLGGGLQIEPESHVVQKWGPVYDGFDVWLRKIKEMLDPNNIGDWSAYVPPVFP
jgi:glycolate oxidase